MPHRHSLSLLSLFLILGLAAPALAQDHPAADAKPEAKPAPTAHEHERARARSERPQIVSKGYGAWALRCRKEPEKKAKEEAAKAERPCEISETISAPNHAGTLAKVTVARPGGGTGPLSVLVLLPNNVSFPSSVHIRTDAKDIWGVELPWTRCIPGACLAQTTLAKATIDYWHKLKTTGQIVFMDSTGQQITLPMSFDGFGDALDALDKAE